MDVDGAREADGAAFLHVDIFRSPDVRLSRYRKESTNIDKKRGCCENTSRSCDTDYVKNHQGWVSKDKFCHVHVSHGVTVQCGRAMGIQKRALCYCK